MDARVRVGHGRKGRPETCDKPNYLGPLKLRNEQTRHVTYGEAFTTAEQYGARQEDPIGRCPVEGAAVYPTHAFASAERVRPLCRGLHGPSGSRCLPRQVEHTGLPRTQVQVQSATSQVAAIAIIGRPFHAILEPPPAVEIRERQPKHWL